MRYIDKKRMVFSFYLSETSFDDEVNKLHFKLLQRYIPIFDEIIFCIIVGDNATYNHIVELEKRIVECKPRNIIFKIFENTNYRESLIFYEEISKQMNDLDGLTFFGHNKGISYDNVDEGTLKWITALYYFNLEVGLPNFNMNGDCFYGALKCINIFLEDYSEGSSVILPKYNWVYCGTFFWGKYQEVANLLNNMGREVPKMYSRWFDEMFTGNILEEFWGKSYLDRCADRMLAWSSNIDEFILTTYNGEEWVYNNFIEFYNYIMSYGDIG